MSREDVQKEVLRGGEEIRPLKDVPRRDFMKRSQVP